jgi:hypothetical protein
LLMVRTKPDLGAGCFYAASLLSPPALYRNRPSENIRVTRGKVERNLAWS